MEIIIFIVLLPFLFALEMIEFEIKHRIAHWWEDRSAEESLPRLSRNSISGDPAAVGRDIGFPL